MDHIVIDPRGYWGSAGEAELIARLAVSVERARWQVVLAKHLSPETCRLVNEEVVAWKADQSHTTIEEASHENR
ncbi:MAG TPA: hypothetical protein VJV04_10750 [Nitrospiraceae bacterium]|nr:hypothetical protein [Nitrospiraceae bacterium]